METPAYWLVGVDGVTRKVRLPITGPVLIGRGAYNHVVLKDARISRQHARLAPEREGTIVYDLNSTNGTFVNGTSVERRVLELNDVVRFGSLAFRIERAAPDARPDEHPADLEKPTLREMGSVSKMLVSSGPRDSSTQQLPIVDLGQLEDAYEKLGTLYSFMQAISKTIDREELVALIAEQMREVYPTAAFVAIYLIHRENGSSEFRLAHRVGANVETAIPAEVSAALLESGEAVFGANAMYAPMVDRNDTLGIVHVAADERGGRFSRADLDLLSGMAAPAAMMLKNARMHDEQLLRERLEYDLELAAQIQRSFLPREVISVEGWELFAEYRAAYSVGGDFYDVFWVAPDRLGVFVGDIAGKGVAGALLMARISSELRVAALAHVDPVKVLATMNRALLGRGQPELFFTAIYLTFDVKTGEVLLSNAGHPLPYVLRASGRTVETIADGASGPVGVLEDPVFTSTRFSLGHGDSLILYTDGVIEAADAQGGLYGVERLESCLSFAGTRPHEIAEHILHSVEHHAGDVPVSDDLTLFICQRNIHRPPSLQPRRRSGMLPSING